MGDSVINTRRTNQLADDNTLRSIDHEGACLCHKREVAHEDFMFIDLVLLLIDQTDPDFERCCIGSIALLALFNRILHIGRICAQLVVDKLQAQLTAVVLNRGDVIESFLQTFLQEPVIGILLNLDQVRHLEDFFLSLVSHAHISAAVNHAYPVFLH